MAEFRLPLIDREDYDAFRRILYPHLPDTYDKWEYLHTKEMGDIAMMGHVSKSIKIYPDEFVAFCTSHGTEANFKSLGDFAVDKAARQNNRSIPIPGDSDSGDSNS